MEAKPERAAPSAPHAGHCVLPAIGYGTWGQSGKTCSELVCAALNFGYRYIDTARRYGNEEDVGAGIRKSSIQRDALFVGTKVMETDLTPRRVRHSVDASLSALRLDYVDLLMIHWPNPGVPLEDSLDALDGVRACGKARFLGVANFSCRLLAAATQITRIEVNQVEYHPYLAQDDVLSECRKSGVRLSAYCPLARGKVLLSDPVLTEIAQEKQLSVAQVVLRWLIQQDGVVAVVGTKSLAHLRANLAAYACYLTEDEMARIRALSRAYRVVNPAKAPMWD
jgi:diketogulonate reductase-like aldo/keto reductase